MLTEGEIIDRIQTAFADPTSLGSSQIVAAPGAGKKIVVVGYQLMNNAGTANSVHFRSAATPKTSGKNLGANAGNNVLPTVVKLFECADNEALNINLSAATLVGVDVQYYIDRVG